MSLLSHLNYSYSIPGGGLYYERGYEQLTGYEEAWKRDALLALESVLMVILAVAGIYSIEYNTGMMRLLKTTPLGRKDLRSAKLWIGAGLVTVIFAMVYGSELYRILSAFGTKGWNCSVACMSHIPMKLSGLTVADYLICRRAKSFIMTMVYSAAVFAVPLVLYLSGVQILRYILLNPLLLGNIF